MPHTLQRKNKFHSVVEISHQSDDNRGPMLKSFEKSPEKNLFTSLSLVGEAERHDPFLILKAAGGPAKPETQLFSTDWYRFRMILQLLAVRFRTAYRR